MNARHKQRLFYFSVIAIVVTVAISLILYALQQNINAFLTPTTLIQQANNRTVRLGGMVKMHSLIKQSLDQTFVVTDFQNDITVHYHGILPDLFREGAGVVVEGQRQPDQIFEASMVLAKHDEKYMPRNIQQQLARNTHA